MYQHTQTGWVILGTALAALLVVVFGFVREPVPLAIGALFALWVFRLATQ